MRELMCMMRACDRDEGVHERDSVCVCECVCVCGANVRVRV